MTELITFWLAGFCTGVAFTGGLAGWHRRRMGPPKGSYGPRQPAPGMRRVYYDMPSTVAECGGPCEAGPEYCDCGQLWRDEPIRLDPGPVQRGNGKGGPTTPKPGIIPKPQPPPCRVVDVHGMTIGYIPFPRSQGDTPNPPPSNP